MSTETAASPRNSVSTHILDTSIGRPAEGVAISLSARTGLDGEWAALGGSATDADGRCKDLAGAAGGHHPYVSTSRPRRISRRSKPRRSRTPPA